MCGQARPVPSGICKVLGGIKGTRKGRGPAWERYPGVAQEIAPVLELHLSDAQERDILAKGHTGFKGKLSEDQL